MAKRMVCPNCLHVGPTKTVTRGSFFIEVILWLCFLIPGVLYTVWRLTTRSKACAKCGNTQLVPLDTPRGQQLIKDNGLQATV